ncbi:MAG: hypothetical protein AAFV53_08110 [Myxococcota bacterium]
MSKIINLHPRQPMFSVDGPLDTLSNGAPVDGVFHPTDGDPVPIQIIPHGAHPESAMASTASVAEKEATFRLQLELDVEYERLVLLRTVLILETLGFFILLRQVVSGG